MKKEQIFQEIQSLLEATREQTEWISNSEGRIPRIELDIILGNVRKLYESLKMLETVDNQIIEKPLVTVNAIINEIPMQPVVPVVPVQEVLPEIQPVMESVQPEEHLHVVQEQVEKVSEIAFPEPVIAEVQEEVPVMMAVIPEPTVIETTLQPEELLVPVNTPVEASVQEIKVEEVMPLAQQRKAEFTKPSAKANLAATLFDDTPTLADNFHGEPTIYDKITGQQSDTSIAHQHQMTPVTDLKKSIGINEKFLFINELFDGDLSAYNSCIDQLNLCGNVSQALELLQLHFAQPLSWDSNAKATIQLKNLVERRYL